MGTSGRKRKTSSARPPSGGRDRPTVKEKPAAILVQTSVGPVLIINKKEVGQRLKQIRKQMGYRQATQFAEEAMQMEYNTWHAYERGQTLLPIAMAIKLIKQCPGLTMDWIYRRSASGLSHELWLAFGSPADVPLD